MIKLTNIILKKSENTTEAKIDEFNLNSNAISFHFPTYDKHHFYLNNGYILILDINDASEVLNVLKNDKLW